MRLQTRLHLLTPLLSANESYSATTRKYLSILIDRLSVAISKSARDKYVLQDTTKAKAKAKNKSNTPIYHLEKKHTHTQSNKH